jgi:SAM-dependent methyltransferase
MGGESWEHVWRERGAASLMGGFLARHGDLQRIVFHALKESGALHDSPAVLEVGCGTGPVLSMLDTPMKFGADLSQSAAAITSRHTPAVVADGARLPFRDCTFDLVYSTGVLDLYGDEEAERLLKEHVRVLRPGGRAVVTTAWDGCRLHESIMNHLKRRNRWRYGSKRTFRSLEHILPPGVLLLCEHRRGAVFQLRFVSYLFEDVRLLRRLYHGVFLVMSILLRRLNGLPGALLISRMEKK